MCRVLVLVLLVFGCCVEAADHDYGVLCPARSCVEQCALVGWGGEGAVSYLGWWAREDGLAFVIKEHGDLAGVTFGYASGCKVNFDVQFPHRAWDLDLRWTTFYDCATKTHRKNLVPLWVLPQIYPSIDQYIFYQEARATWKVHLNEIDLELGYDPLLSEKMSMRLHAGIKGISLFQHYTIDYEQGELEGFGVISPSRCGLRNECMGVGPRFGFASKWRLGRGWSLLGHCAGALTLDYFALKRKDEDRAESAISSVFREHFYAFHPIIEALIGLGWECCVNRRPISVQAAYEMQYFWEQLMVRQLVAQQISFQSFSPRGDFSVQGINATISFGF
jgi:hypothetical protein